MNKKKINNFHFSHFKSELVIKWHVKINEFIKINIYFHTFIVASFQVFFSSCLFLKCSQNRSIEVDDSMVKKNSLDFSSFNCHAHIEIEIYFSIQWPLKNCINVIKTNSTTSLHFCRTSNYDFKNGKKKLK